MALNASQQRLQKLIAILSDGKCHSGQSLADELAVSRTAIWKLIQKLESWDINIWPVRGKGYQVSGGLDLLDEQKLGVNLREQQNLFEQFRLFSSIDSTATYMADWWRSAPGPARVCIAEHQSAGRGRKGRPWISPFASNFYFSIGIEMPLGLNALGGLSLAIGIGLAQSLNRQMGQSLVKVKWPNDLLVDNRKLAGILVEASGDSNDTSFLNIGIGINWKMKDSSAAQIDQPWIDLQSLPIPALSRQQMLEQLLVDLSNTLSDYSRAGFTQFQPLWPELSAMYRQQVSLLTPHKTIEGEEIGVNSQGALLLASKEGITPYFSGEASLRKSNLTSNY